MKRSKLVIELKGDDSQPLFLRLATSILSEIERGRLLPGDRLPGTRSLALSLNIHRNTVTAAFQELMMQGWLVAEPSRGTVVAYDLPSVKLRSDKEAVVAAAEIPSDEPCNVFHISDGTPDARIMPAAEMARASDMPCFSRPICGEAAMASREALVPCVMRLPNIWPRSEAWLLRRAKSW